MRVYLDGFGLNHPALWGTPPVEGNFCLIVCVLLVLGFTSRFS